jgi:hypothetical protein
MGALMDLVAGDDREILLAISVDDWASFADRSRFDAHLPLGGGIDPTWLDLFSEAVRTVTKRDDPADFLDARRELEGPGDLGERTVVDAVAGRWIDLIEEELGDLPREEKPWIRTLAGDIVVFARTADRSAAVLFAWSL